MKVLVAACAAVLCVAVWPQRETPAENRDFDETVESFLKEKNGTWRDMNVLGADGRILHDIIVKNGYTCALEIGTSTGHSSVWIAWALSRTGGRLTTIEIDSERHEKALANFKEAGVEDYIDAVLGDAHELAPALEGPYDFIFIDADKPWYPNYLKDLYPKLVPGGCITAHNVLDGFSWTSDFLKSLDSLPDMETEIVRSSRSGLSVSYRKCE